MTDRPVRGRPWGMARHMASNDAFRDRLTRFLEDHRCGCSEEAEILAILRATRSTGMRRLTDVISDDMAEFLREPKECDGHHPLTEGCPSCLPPPQNFGSQVAIRSGLPKDVAARIDAIENGDSEALPPPSHLDVRFTAVLGLIGMGFAFGGGYILALVVSAW